MNLLRQTKRGKVETVALELKVILEQDAVILGDIKEQLLLMQQETRAKDDDIVIKDHHLAELDRKLLVAEKDLAECWRDKLAQQLVLEKTGCELQEEANANVELKSENEAMGAVIVQKDTAIKKRDGEIHVLSTNWNEEIELNRHQREHIACMQREYRQLEFHYVEKWEMADRLQANITELQKDHEEEINNLRDDAVKLNSSKVELHADSDRLRKKISDLEKLLRDHESHYMALQRNLMSLQEKISGLQEETEQQGHLDSVGAHQRARQWQTADSFMQNVQGVQEQLDNVLHSLPVPVENSLDDLMSAAFTDITSEAPDIDEIVTVPSTQVKAVTVRQM